MAKRIKHRALSLGVLFFLCLFVAAEPFRIANAALEKANSMPCCAGKAGHCESGIAAKKVRPPKAEPMCGLKGAHAEDDGITIVAEPVSESPHSHSQTAESSSSQPAAESASLNSPCHMDCASCAAGATRQQKRESIVLSNTYHATSATTSAKYEDESLLFSSSHNWPRINPRGPPAGS